MPKLQLRERRTRYCARPSIILYCMVSRAVMNKQMYGNQPSLLKKITYRYLFSFADRCTKMYLYVSLIQKILACTICGTRYLGMRYLFAFFCVFILFILSCTILLKSAD